MSANPTPTDTESPAQVLARTRVRAAMQLGLFECEPSADVRTLARIMAERRIHAVVVPRLAGRGAASGRLAWGIVSDIQLMGALGPVAEGSTAGALARTDAVAVLPSTTLEEAARMMAEHDTAHLVVVSPDTDRPVGMVSTLDIARVAAGL